MIKIIKKRDGYAILELLFYIAFFSILSLVVINAMITMARSFRETAIQTQLVQSGTIMERMSREIRAAYDINSIGASDLKLNTKDSGGANKTVEFLLSGSNLQLLENNILTGNLNTSNIMIAGLAFTQITTVKGKAVKIFLTVKSSDDALGRNQDFYDTIVLRGSY
jgi:type II secretory pathway pseudopilin PulG